MNMFNKRRVYGYPLMPHAQVRYEGTNAQNNEYITYDNGCHVYKNGDESIYVYTPEGSLFWKPGMNSVM